MASKKKTDAEGGEVGRLKTAEERGLRASSGDPAASALNG